MQNFANSENTEKLLDKLTKSISNLPENVLADLQKECKHIFVVDKIPNPTSIKGEPKAMAVGGLNQIFFSAKVMSEISNEQTTDTLVHELGHLVDQTSSNIGACSKWHNKAYANLKKTLQEDLGFDKESHSLDTAKELFADYYLFKSGIATEDNRCRKLFDTINSYKSDYEEFNSDDFRSKYGDKSEKIVFMLKEWEKLENNYEYFLRNLDSKSISRANFGMQPMSIEQIVE